VLPVRALRTLGCSLLVFILIFGVARQGAWADSGDLSGLISPSACRVGAVLSIDQFIPAGGFIGPGRSNLRIAIPDEEIVAGTWAIVNNFVPDQSVIAAPNCPGGIGSAVDGAGLNLMAVEIETTISSPQEADIEYIKLVFDVNANGLWEPLTDLVLQTRPGSMLMRDGKLLFYNGPQEPLAILSNSGAVCGGIGIGDAGPAVGIGPGTGTNTRAGSNGCYISLLAIAKVGANPTNRTKFGLQLTAYAGDIPGTTGVSSFTISSGFSSSRNPQASNATVEIFGGLPGPDVPFDHLNNGVGNPESSFDLLEFTGGNNNEGLKTRFRAARVEPGTREAIIYAGGLCDGGFLATTQVPILPSIAGAPPTIAGGLASVPCVPSAGTDGLFTGLNSAILRITGPREFLQLIGTVRMYADIDCDGILFEPGEELLQRVPFYNEPTNEMFVFFNREQNGFLFTPGGAPLAGGCPAVGAPAGADASPFPLIILWTADINNSTSAGHFGPQVAAQQLEGFFLLIDAMFGAAPGESNFYGPSTPAEVLTSFSSPDLFEPPNRSRIPGDFNRNGVVSRTDVDRAFGCGTVFNVVTKTGDAFQPVDARQCDLDGNGSTNDDDLNFIYENMTRLIENFGLTDPPLPTREFDVTPSIANQVREILEGNGSFERITKLNLFGEYEDPLLYFLLFGEEIPEVANVSGFIEIDPVTGAIIEFPPPLPVVDPHFPSDSEEHWRKLSGRIHSEDTIGIRCSSPRILIFNSVEFVSPSPPVSFNDPNCAGLFFDTTLTNPQTGTQRPLRCEDIISVPGCGELELQMGDGYLIYVKPANTFLPPASANLTELNVKPRFRSHDVVFSLNSQTTIHSAKLEIFDLTGREVYASAHSTGQSLRWNLRNNFGERVANGVYLYAITAYGANGMAVRSEVKKLAILR